MAIYKCKMCGGALEINNKESVATCEYCGTQQTLPRLDDDRKVNLYDRANHFRRNSEFDKAMRIYEQILSEDSTDAEAYWSLVLCRYGIEYVEDPASHKRVPTVNRAQYTSIYDDDNYKSALQHADSYQRGIYEGEAKAINEIQKGILEISQKEEPFDVFICYKESDNDGRRTQDSVLAQDLYYLLNEEGFKVFFARITLEDKLGSAYEPYIFAALNSAKVMVVLGTRPEFFNAAWVKNEWSRYLSLIKGGAKKTLIPAYKDMDPYDLPEEFSHLQAQDMSKLGFMQDIIRGIKKITKADEEKEAVVKETAVTGSNNNASPLLKRAFMFLEDGDWQSADEYCERVLDLDPENALGYLGKLMAELRVRKQEDLNYYAKPFDGSNNYQKVLRFGDDELKATLQGYIEYINDRNEEIRLEENYKIACDAIHFAESEIDYKEVANLFQKISEYKDSAVRAEKCLEAAEAARKDAIFSAATSEMDRGQISDYEAAIEMFESISGWRSADEQIDSCHKRIEEIKAKAEAERLESERQAKRNKKIVAIIFVVFVFVCLVRVFTVVFVIPIQKKNDFIARYGQEVYDKLGLVEEGAYISFGIYEQDNDTSNGKEDIKWLVLEVVDGKALVISKYALDAQPYNIEAASDCIWETCSLREWLNSAFINDAFSDSEKTMILTANLTQDQVFLLSVAEVEEYFDSDGAGQFKATAYAQANGSGSYWWLRTPGKLPGYASYVTSGGNIALGGDIVSVFGVRPALWIDLSEFPIK
ncbi:MAG: toll/interleukin-1 receptor domain-containing protein [Lachnospiraceae bacterium]|nr:toll/interleukin-1 receptor domain-containing protein [Lachnospiraceae bacterium]